MTCAMRLTLPKYGGNWDGLRARTILPDSERPFSGIWTMRNGGGASCPGNTAWNVLEPMATIYPVTLDELQNIPGVGAGKAKRYGEEFCKLIKRHCEENEIERPEDLRVRTVANKSKMKVAIIQAIDRKVALDDIALSKGIEFGELLDEVEAIVYSGTKLNIDYFLEEIMDEDHLLDIYDYFKESTTDKIDDALDELGDDFTEEEVRLVRIKFISEMAN